MKNFKELYVWQNGIALVKKIFLLTQSFPAEQKFGIVSQITRAAVSIPANIAEGSSRKSAKDYARYLQISLGSAFEVQTYLVIAEDLDWISQPDLVEVNELLEIEIKMLHSFIKKVSELVS